MSLLAGFCRTLAWNYPDCAGETDVKNAALMRRATILIATFLAASAPALAQREPKAQSARIPVIVTGVPEEQAARRLSRAVVKALGRDPRFRMVDERDAGAVTISLPSRVGWDRRLDWTEIHFQARVTGSAGQSRVVAGQCWNWNFPVCANQIVNAAAEIGGN